MAQHQDEHLRQPPPSAREWIASRVSFIISVEWSAEWFAISFVEKVLIFFRRPSGNVINVEYVTLYQPSSSSPAFFLFLGVGRWLKDDMRHRNFPYRLSSWNTAVSSLFLDSFHRPLYFMLLWTASATTTRHTADATHELGIGLAC